MKRHTATCGHKIESGISCSIDEGQIFSDGGKAITFGTYCSNCMFKHFKSGIIRNDEMIEFAEMVARDRYEKLQAENAKLREVVSFYADRNSYNVNPFEILTKYSIARLIKFDDVEEIDEVNCGGKRARQVLKELEDK